MGARFELETWLQVEAGKFDIEVIQPLQLAKCFVTTETSEEAFKKFVEMRRKHGLYVNMAVVTPHLLKYSDKITLWDHQNISLGDIETVDSLPGLVANNLDRINPDRLGKLRAYFPDDSMLEVSIPLDERGVNQADPASIEY